ncbi:MAG: hypothetical protein FWB97_05500 [Oscillospiraceae bacterium]|nr:hypothetical protein [Oscillospiraceae bacterium]
MAENERITNENYVNGIKRIPYEEILADPENMKCQCLAGIDGAPSCDYKGKCKECVAIHKYYGGVPHCLRELVETQVKEAVQAAQA